MRYIETFKDGDRLSDVYFVKNVQQATTRNGKAYLNVTLQDKTGTADAKIWEPDDGGIDDFDKMDYIDVVGEVSMYNGSLQVTIRRARKCQEGEYEPSDYLPTSRFDIEKMYEALIAYIEKMENKDLKTLCENIFIKDEDFVQRFKKCSAAKSIHHGFIGGLLEHTFSVTRLCAFLASSYSYLNKDLLVTAAMCHDMGKVRELSLFPENDYTDDGQLLGHIVMGYEMIGEYAAQIEGFDQKLLSELRHCILAHHGELEFGSPKKPAIAEAIALSFADNTDAKLETMREALVAGENAGNEGWLGFNKFLDSNIRKTV